MSRVQRQGTDHADRRPHEVQCAVPALPRHRQESDDLPDMPRRGRRGAPNRWRSESNPARAMGSAFAWRARAMPEPHGGAAGDLYVIIRTGDHPSFTATATTSHLTVPVTATEAALGAKIEVPTIDGRALLKIPAGDAVRAKATAAGEGRALGDQRRRARRRDRGSKDQLFDWRIEMNGPERFLRELAKVNREDLRDESV